jgi:hypothetical protein
MQKGNGMKSTRLDDGVQRPCAESAGNPHPARVKKVGYRPRHWSQKRAENFRLQWGRYAGYTVAELSRFDDGVAYLRWLASHRMALAGTAAGVVLGVVELKPEGGDS